MKKLTLRLGIALLTFFFGVTAALWWSHYRVPTISFCELASKPEKYHGRIVRVRGDIHSDMGTLVITPSAFEDCSVPNIGVKLDAPKIPTPRVQQVIEDILCKNCETERYAGGAVVLGKFDATTRIVADTPGCFITDAIVESASEILVIKN